MEVGGGGGLSHVPLRNDADPDWRALHAAADADRAELTRQLYAVFAALAARTVLLRLRSALRAGNTEAAIQAVPVADLVFLRPALEDVLRRVAMHGARIGQSGELVARLGTSQGLPVAELAFWARQHSAALVVGITEQTRLALRQAIVEAITLGLSPAKAAPLIEASLGLNRPQVEALLNRMAALREAGLTAGQIQIRLASYARRLIRQRARVIARHELMLAANAGRRAQWDRNVRDGLIAPDRWEREWVAIVPSDGRTCPYCEGQDGARAPINGVYPDGSGGPPGHVLCRCTEIITRRVA